MPDRERNLNMPLRLIVAAAAALLCGYASAVYNPAPRVVAHVDHDLHVAVHLADRIDARL